MRVVKTDYRFVRGHMCPRNVAERISDDAAYNIHTLLNAVPQLQWQNNGIWRSLEEDIEDWADEYGRVWVVCGTLIIGKLPALWLGQVDDQKGGTRIKGRRSVTREREGLIPDISMLVRTSHQVPCAPPRTKSLMFLGRLLKPKPWPTMTRRSQANVTYSRFMSLSKWALGGCGVLILFLQNRLRMSTLLIPMEIKPS